MCRRLICLVSFVLALGLTLTGPAKADLVGWWKFEEGSGATANDSSGNGHHGTLLGIPEWVLGPDGFGGALAFNPDGCTGIDCGIFDPTDGTGQFTVALWAFWDGTGTYQHFLSKSNAYGADTMMFQFELWGAHTDAAYTDRVGVTYQAAGSVAFSIMPKNQWVHLALTFDGSNAVVYLNGVDEEGPKPFSIGPNVDAMVEIGYTSTRPSGIWRTFHGPFDDVRIYSRALTAKEIQQLMIGIPPGAASDPSPANEAADVPRDVVLSWTPGEFAPAVNGHAVYLGESFSDVNEGTGAVTQDANTYDPGRLNLGTTYYWRIDEVNAPPDSTVYKGNVWSFTTEPVGYPISGANVTATASSTGQADFGPEKTIDGSGLDDNGLHSTGATDMWLSSSEPLGAWIQYEFDKVCKLHQMWVWNANQMFEALYGFGLRDVAVEYSTDSVEWAALAGAPEFAQAPGTADYAHNTTVDFAGALARYVRLTATSNWGGILPQYGLSEVRFFSIPVSAREPSPDSGATDVDPDVTLGWRAGREAATHNVYLSTDEQAVIDGTPPAVAVSDASYTTILDLGSTYYWRIDEVNDAGTPTTWQGDIWSFSTLEYLVVEGFEDYNDYPPDEIYTTWLDGYENPANGSQVGYLTPPSVETAIVHGDNQSMPLLYSNTGGATYSEAERTFAVPQDWTRYGVKTLGLWFQGTAGNTGQLYVKVNGVKVPYDGDAGNLALAAWQPWNIDLTALGMNLQSVTTLAIGIDGNGAAGTLYADDIRLYAYDRQLVTPAEPNSEGLAGHYKLDQDASDSSGNNNHGTLVGNLQWAPGKVGSALSVDGTTGIADHAAIPTAGLSVSAGTIAMWAKLAPDPQAPATRYFFGHTTIPAYGNRIQLYMDDSDTTLDMGLGDDHNRHKDIIPLATEIWYHIALTWDGSHYVVYVNGAAAANGSYAGLDTLNTVADIGNDGNTDGREEAFNGLLDDVRIYSRVLS
ncbi:MAG: discoidin domain-containing protein, partial [Phycisphaerales bacterium]